MPGTGSYNFNPLVICMITDFFYPNLGGIETHILALSKALTSLGHTVFVITHAHENYSGIHYITNGLKVYYLPRVTCANVVFPTMYSLPKIRKILIREKVDVVHGHSSFSILAQEGMIIAQLLGLKTVVTDHSLNELTGSIPRTLNKLQEIALSGVNHSICVTQAGKENTILRTKLPADKVSVIPNGIDTSVFTLADPILQKNENQITIVAISRLANKKGIELLASVIPIICRKYPEVDFLIGGDGPKRSLLEEVIEREALHDRVQLLGSLQQSEVHETHLKGDLFLNTSVSEAFGMTILEAASSGLQVVSTNVGGIPELLPTEMIVLAEPNEEAIVTGVEGAIQAFKNGTCTSPSTVHFYIDRNYSWDDVARKTQIVYENALQQPHMRTKQLRQRFRSSGGPFFGIYLSGCNLALRFLERFWPRYRINGNK